MVPPQFTPCGASWDPNRSAGCTGPYPSSSTGKPFHEAAPKGIPRRHFHCLAPTGSSLAKWGLACTIFLQRVLEDEISSSLPPPFAEVNKNFGFFSSFCIKTPIRFCISIPRKRIIVHLSRKMRRIRQIRRVFLIGSPFPGNHRKSPGRRHCAHRDPGQHTRPGQRRD